MNLGGVDPETGEIVDKMLEEITEEENVVDLRKVK